MFYAYHDSPLGALLLLADDQGLRSIVIQAGRKRCAPESHWMADVAPFGNVVEQLDGYFAGRRKSFDLTLAPQGTPFQHEVWQTLETIPYGETWSYGQLAKAIDRPKASRAVGAANGANPLPIVIPCHRVIGADGSLTGFGGGLDNKRRLLALEGALPQTAAAAQRALSF